MGLLSFKPLAAVLLVLTFISALGGITVYYMHFNTLKALTTTPTIGEVLDRVKSLEYTVTIGSDEYRIVLENDPSSRSGEAMLYLNGELQYTIYYEYGENALTSLTRVEAKAGLESTLDVLQWEEAFLTGLSFTQGPQGEIIGVDVFPGIMPLYTHYYISSSLAINWQDFITLGGVRAPVRVNIDFSTIETPLGSMRGITVFLSPQFPGASPNPWAQAPLSIDLVRIEGVLVAQQLSYSILVPGAGDAGIVMELQSIEVAG